MNLLTTKLSKEQAEIISWLEVMYKIVKFVNPAKLEIPIGSEEEMIVDGLTIYYDEDRGGFVAGYVEQSGGSYWQPPDYDFVEFAWQGGSSLITFVRQIITKIFFHRLNDSISNETERRFYEEENILPHGQKRERSCPVCIPDFYDLPL